MKTGEIDMRRRTLLTIAALLATAPALAHGPQGHSVSRETAAGVPGDTNALVRIVEISMQEGDGNMLFAPEEITVAVNEQVRFRLKNDGELEHEFILGTAEEIEEHAEMMQAMPDMDHDDPNAKRLQPKQTGDLVWKFSAPGELYFACLIPGHREAGMTGKIIVK